MKRRLSASEFEQLQRENPEVAARYRMVPLQAPVRRQQLSVAEFEKLQRENPEEAKNYLPMKEVSLDQIRQMKIGRNEKCPCKSGKKFKKCCMGK